MSSIKSAKLFVANLSSRTKRNDLEDAFDKFGKIIDINIKDKDGGERYAFVEFDDPRDAEDALDKMNNSELLGRKLRLEFSHGGRRSLGIDNGRRRSERDESSKKGTACFICNKKGHWANECPKGDGANIRQGKCFLCGSTSHKMKDCSKKRSFSRSLSRSSNSRSRSKSRSRSRSRDKRRISKSRSRSHSDYSRDRSSRKKSKDRSRRKDHSKDRKRKKSRSYSRSRSSSYSR